MNNFEQKVATNCCDVVLHDIPSEDFCTSDDENDSICHFLNNFEPKSGKKVANKYYCKICDYNAVKKYNWDKHIQTEKHVVNTVNKTATKVAQDHECKICGKVYKGRSGLWQHEKKCVPIKYDYEYKKSESDILKITTMFLESMKQNQDFQKEIIAIVKDTGSVSNSHNTNMVTTNNKQKFNMNFFLNETCKNAMNLSEFVDTLQITLADLENVGKLGYEEGISRIFTNGLKALDVSRRPIHCSDVKRETVYVKNDNKWDKDSDQLRRAIKLITNKNIKLIPKWKEANPGHHLYHNKKNDEYLKIMYESMGPTDESEEKKSFGKIITNLAKHTVIHKDI
jgi:hypothetical protein